MGYKAVTLHHGPRERGKDVVCIDHDRLGNREYLGIVAKAVDLTGSVSSEAGLSEVLRQVEQCFDVPYEDLFNMSRVTMHRVWVITSRRVVPGASDAVFEHLRKQNLDKLVRVISGEQLVALVDKHFPEYWDASAEPADRLRERAMRLEQFTRRLLEALGADADDLRQTLHAVAGASDLPEIRVNAGRTLSRLSPYSVEIDIMTGDLAKDFYSNSCGSLPEAFTEAKRLVYYAMFEVDEIMDKYERVIRQSDPRAFVDAFDEGLRNERPFWNAFGGSPREAVDAVDALSEGIQEVDRLRERLASAGKEEWAMALIASVQSFEHEIHAELQHIDKDPFELRWRVETSAGMGRLTRLHDRSAAASDEILTTSHSRVRRRTSWPHGQQTRPATAKDVLDDVREALRQFLERLVPEHGTTAL
jgi:hypothetical protein